ncbi:hypothetical protein B0H13DRAFT_1875960 [Mycena leptocephala]|nr:hypothetical protein B0H13DRAFT_1897288 [Mycena leptocephala]KAJ7911305.1 hypothetical protein B0H13DRAFT_1875960 [Mycena leptocephala]
MLSEGLDGGQARCDDERIKSGRSPSFPLLKIWAGIPSIFIKILAPPWRPKPSSVLLDCRLSIQQPAVARRTAPSPFYAFLRGLRSPGSSPFFNHFYSIICRSMILWGHRFFGTEGDAPIVETPSAPTLILVLRNGCDWWCAARDVMYIILCAAAQGNLRVEADSISHFADGDESARFRTWACVACGLGNSGKSSSRGCGCKPNGVGGCASRVDGADGLRRSSVSGHASDPERRPV